MTVTDIDRISAVQNKLFEVKAWVDETLKILNYVVIDTEHKAFRDNSSVGLPLSKAGLYPGQYQEDTITAEVEGDTEEEEEEECTS